MSGQVYTTLPILRESDTYKDEKMQEDVVNKYIR